MSSATVVAKTLSRNTALKKLRSFLDTNEPELVAFLHTLWHNQGRAITYKELREAILAGDISEEWLHQWQIDYSRFVQEYLKPKWELAMLVATQEIQRKYPEWYFNPTNEGIKIWTETRSASFVTNSVGTQIQCIRAVVRRAAVLEDMSVDELARAIRPIVGLTYQQGIANLNYFTTLVNNGMSTQKARDMAMRYAARQHRYRGYNIARTELAFAYNKGTHFGVRQAQEAGYMGKTIKRWCTADDERVCTVCGTLDGAVADMDEDFNFTTKLERTNHGIKRTPPAHPSCRCVVLYEEVEPPKFTNKPAND